ncbi:MAG: hypothetical protein EHM41_00875 [Chloroflexi bacterium]|nr:MAG: hypothetical protein EHM41_00875 [Chloroflexota bacterium]
MPQFGDLASIRRIYPDFDPLNPTPHFEDIWHNPTTRERDKNTALWHLWSYARKSEYYDCTPRPTIPPIAAPTDDITEDEWRRIELQEREIQEERTLQEMREIGGYSH